MASLHAGKLARDSQGQMGEERRGGRQEEEKENRKMDKNRGKDRSGNEDGRESFCGVWCRKTSKVGFTFDEAQASLCRVYHRPTYPTGSKPAPTLTPTNPLFQFKNVAQPRGLLMRVRLTLRSGNSISRPQLCGIIKRLAGPRRRHCTHAQRGSAGPFRPPDQSLYSGGIKFTSGPILLF